MGFLICGLFLSISFLHLFTLFDKELDASHHFFLPIEKKIAYVAGQEDATIDMEGETKITPFNMKEELEEGHFDRDGFYHFKKETETLKDAWLDNIDWIKVDFKRVLSEFVNTKYALINHYQ